MKVQAEVTAIEGSPGDMFAVTRPIEKLEIIGEGETITFTLHTAWAGGERSPPDEELIVILDGVQRYKRGWRATVAYPFTLEDVEEPEVKEAGK